ncbi:exosortase A [Sphingomonas sp. 28-63-12]|uniref:exosortase A n=1 Tax=Sphingomonas sp. 28-63-12 TaxID=1970434 RepID=UPI000BD0F7D6|nr:MAG: exosortase [Sphingomonas sp. 28-63-12]
MTIAFPAAAFKADAGEGAVAAWRRQGGLLGGVALILLILFGHDSADLGRIWWTSTTFGHCLFIGPVIGWLVWQRRHDLARLRPVGWAPGLAIILLGGGGWLMGAAASVALARHLGLIVMLQGAVVTLLGPQVARGLLFPLAYAFFLVPFGESLETPLQGVTVAMVMPMLHAVGVPASVDGVLITIPNGYFEVAEACSGAKFVIAMIAYGTLVANVAYVSWPRRIAFMAMALLVPIIANGVRAFGTIYAAHLTSVEAATGMDHIIYGWVFFGLVMAAVIAIGWRWFDRDPDAPWFDAAALRSVPRFRIDGMIAATLVLTSASAFAAWAGALSAQVARLPDRIMLPGVPGWQRTNANLVAPWAPYYPGADHFLAGRYADGKGAAIDLALAVFGSQRDGKELVSFGTGALREDDRWVRIEDLPDIAGGAAMRITAPGHIERIVVTWYRIGGNLTASPRAVKLETLKAKLLGMPPIAVAVHISAQILPGRDARAAIEQFVQAAGPIDRLVDQVASGH